MSNEACLKLSTGLVPIEVAKIGFVVTLIDSSDMVLKVYFDVVKVGLSKV